MRVMTVEWSPDTGWSDRLGALDSPMTLVLFFGNRLIEGESMPLEELVAAHPKSIVVGCSTAGQITGRTLRDDECVAAIVQFDAVPLALASRDVRADGDSRMVGAELGAELAADDLRAVFVLSDGLLVNGTDVVRGLVGEVAADVQVTGGLAGDGDAFERTWVFDGVRRSSGLVVAVGMYGDRLRLGSGSGGGWGIFGPDRIVTRSAGNVLFELDSKPALELYKEYLGDLAIGLPASALLFPLAVRAGAGDEEVVRTVLAVDEADQSMTFAGDIPQGWRARLMRSSADRLVDGAAAAAAASREGVSEETPVLGIAISCVGRRLVLGARTDEELDAALDGLPASSELIGFYSYGEIAPGVGGACDLHNQTMTMTTLSEV